MLGYKKNALDEFVGRNSRKVLLGYRVNFRITFIAYYGSESSYDKLNYHYCTIELKHETLYYMNITNNYCLF